MAAKTIVYIKQYDDPLTPVTARIEWLPDGNIKPLSYWVPDGSCFQVKHIYETTELAFLKGHEKGLRFKIRSKVTQTPEPCSYYLHTQHETYLYFSGGWFSGGKFIDERYWHTGKEFIPVTLDIFPDGSYELICFWARGARYLVEKTLSMEPHGSFHAGGVGIRHKVEARLDDADNDKNIVVNNSARRMASLYFEVNKWFIALKIS